MQRQKISQLLSAGTPGQSVSICGWVRSRRESKNFAFVVLNDGSCQDTMQCVVDAGTPAFDVLPRCQTGAAVRVEGLLKESQGKGQKWEVQATAIEVFGEADPESYPLQKKGHTLEFLRDIAHLRPRTNTFGAVFRMRSALAWHVHDFFQRRGFRWVHTPIITSSDCEGAGEMFTVTTLDLAKLKPGPGGGLQPGLFQEARPPDGQWPARGRVHGDGPWRHLYIRTDFPGRKLEYNQALVRVLDDRAGDGFRDLEG